MNRTVKFAYIFSTSNASYILENMIIPQLEKGTHGVQIVGMFFFVDNNYILTADNATAARRAKISEGIGMMIMGCDQCCEARKVDDLIHKAFSIGCFPNLYSAIEGAGGIDQAITL